MNSIGPEFNSCLSTPEAWWEISQGLSECNERNPCAEHVQQLGSESLLSNLMEVKD
jgi:hypothetical protein